KVGGSAEEDDVAVELHLRLQQQLQHLYRQPNPHPQQQPLKLQLQDLQVQQQLQPRKLKLIEETSPQMHPRVTTNTKETSWKMKSRGCWIFLSWILTTNKN
uniref:Uncharacterized protein n=1 Tax=Ciona intestinalis TaxID=7719 RepID=F6QG11_CIOIN